MFKKIFTSIKRSGHEELLKGSFISFVLKTVGILFAQLFAIVVGRALGADAYGAFVLSLSLITIFSILSTLGLDTGILKIVASKSNRTDDISIISNNYLTALLIIIPVSACITLFCYNYSSSIASQIFNKPQLSSYFRIASFGIIPFSIVKLNSEALRGFKNIKEHVFLKYVGTYFFAVSVVILIFYYYSQNEIIVIISYVIGLFLLVLLSFYLLLKRIKLIRYVFQFSRFKSLLYLSLPLLMASSLMFIKGWIDTLMVGYFMTQGDVGVYNISLKVASLISIVLTAVNTISAPVFAESQNDRLVLQENIQKATRLIFILSLPVICIIFFIPEFILGLFGDEFVEGKQTLLILLVGHLVNILAGSVGNVMKMTGKQVALQNITLLTTLMGIILNYTLIPLIGIEGAAISTMATIIFWNISCALILKYQYNLKTYYNPIADFTKWMKNSY